MLGLDLGPAAEQAIFELEAKAGFCRLSSFRGPEGDFAHFRAHHPKRHEESTCLCLLSNQTACFRETASCDQTS
ncbi:hypothetical protein, partial [Mesorhizobium sp.]|uniref:hypothetical protein n=1 Tax=Mesorhizobium sp. TaxID=1871066 RepID=UPI00257A52D2